MSPLKWLSRRTPRVDPEELARTAEESLRETRSQQEHVNALTSYLKNREGQNGFGEDFEITLTPRRA
ncbi:hypothetical protein PBI_CAMILLE_4 [Microbacterium phage Camille]|nr:hypothetical protein PBI_CAMILLE_4 [Microbacterium phage Camille]